MSESTLNFIPRIWADAINKSLVHTSTLMAELLRVEQENHEQALRDDPAYARKYALMQEEMEAENRWIALYENAFPPTEEDIDEW